MAVLQFIVILAMVTIGSTGAGPSTSQNVVIGDGQNANSEFLPFNNPFANKLALRHGYKPSKYIPKPPKSSELDQLVQEWDNYYKEICAKFVQSVEKMESRQSWTMMGVQDHRNQLAEPLEGIRLTITEFRNATEHLRKGVQNSPELLPQHCYLANQIHNARVEWLLAVAEDASNMANTIEALENYAKNWQFKY